MRIFEKASNLLTEIIVSEPKAGWPKSSVFNNLDKLDKIPNANFKESKISMCFWTKIQPIWGFKIFEFYPVKMTIKIRKKSNRFTVVWIFTFSAIQPTKKEGGQGEKRHRSVFSINMTDSNDSNYKSLVQLRNNHHWTVLIFGKKLWMDGQEMKVRRPPTNECM